MTLGLINRGEGERKNESEREREKERKRERWLKNQTQSISYRPAARLK